MREIGAKLFILMCPMAMTVQDVLRGFLQSFGYSNFSVREVVTVVS